MRSCQFTLPFVVAAFAAAGGCSSDEGGGGSGGAGGSGAAGACWPTSDACYVAGPEGPGAECLAKKDNSGEAVWQGRLTSIEVVKPDKLAQQFIQGAIIDNGVSLNQQECNEGGEGTFTWLFQFDPSTNKLKTGGGLPVKDPKAGSCFVTLTNTSLPVGPIEVDVTIDGNNFSASGIDVNVPVFLTPDDTTNALVLPLHDVEFSGTFSDDHNCIGRFNGDLLTPVNNCAPDTSTTPPQRFWENGGTLKGFITIEEADKVFVEELDSTLCVFLAGANEWKGSAKDCATSDNWIAGMRPDADWCSTTNAPADASCKDAWRLEGQFAGAAFQINGDCP